MVYLISYDLNRPGQNYDTLYQKIKDASTGGWCHPMDSTWIIQSYLTPENICNQLRPALDNSDSIFVVQIASNYAGRLPKDLWNYIENMF
nr:MAG TPA: Cas system-associated protein [Caudoviricetes sp.]